MLAEVGVIGNLADLCPTDPPLVGQSILADTLIVEDLPAATRLARRAAARPRLVTLAGEVLEASGAMTGGRLRDQGVSVLADQRRFQELLDELNTLAAQVAGAEAALAALPELGSGAELLRRVQAARAAEAEAARQTLTLETTRASLEAQLRRLEQVAPPAEPEAVAADPAALEAEVLALRQAAEAARAAERAAAETWGLAREAAEAWKAYDQAAVRATELRARLEAGAAAAVAQAAQLELAAAEVARREAALQVPPQQTSRQPKRRVAPLSRLTLRF
ncbi:hypothetical protein ACFP81_02435 [Deinococcus lacus]|uniref:SMC hinge domain-containing protein n=1 Tax=Deinococcus lacus TaxID=392561 RepID=A0ABW1Y9S6_9DEIO